MSKLLRDLLDATEPTFSLSLKKLENLSNHHNVDNSLSAEIIEKAQAALRGLGLDPRDTTDRELYHALEGKVRDHNIHLASSLGTDDSAPVKDIVPHLVKAVEESEVPKQCWVLKKSVAKDLLRQMHPKKMMKSLGYRSIESMFKNENFSEIYAGLRFSEGADWLTVYNELFQKSVTPSDFERRQIEIVVMNHDKWADMAEGFVKKKLHNVTHTKELGVIIIVPMKQTHMKGLTLKTLPLLFHYINEIRLYSAYFKLKSTAPHFGKTITDTLIADVAPGAVIAGHNIHWRVIQRYLGRHKEHREAEAFEPHVQPEDLHWRKAEDSLFKLDNELKFWQDMDYVGRIADDGDPVAFNLFDVSFAFSNEETYAKRYFYHMRESLWNEIFIRYMGVETLREQILQQLDNDMIKPEKLV
ncbi:hypothetical protein KC973_00450 [Candidatus Saccharibacteria bacterium]|nr:hypothetical protein [Candidatus Saccharibacteria bacterium]